MINVPVILQSLVIAIMAFLAHPNRLAPLNGGAAGVVTRHHGLIDGTGALATALELAVHLEVTFRGNRQKREQSQSKENEERKEKTQARMDKNKM